MTENPSDGPKGLFEGFLFVSVPARRPQDPPSMAKNKNKKQNKKNSAPRRCCRRYCIGCPWTIMQLNGGKRKKK